MSGGFSADLNSPRMLSDAELSRLSPSECAALNEQLDQKIVNVLQRIDENFAESTRLITDVILPSVEEYGKSSKEIWDSVKLWKMFFEASAGIRLGAAPAPEPPLQDEVYDQDEYQHDEYGEDADVTARLDEQRDENTRTETQEDVDTSSSSSSGSPATPDTTVRHGSATPEGPPRPSSSAATIIKTDKSKASEVSDAIEPSWADQASPFEQLRENIEKVRIVDSSYASSSATYAPPALKSEGFQSTRPKQEQQGRQQTRLGDLSVDSPDIRRPALETMSFQDPPRATSSQSSKANDAKGKAREMQDYRNHIQNPSPFFHNKSQSTTSQPTPSNFSSSFDLSSVEPPSLLKDNSARPSIGRQSSGTANRNRLLQKVLNKNLGGKDGRPTASTPARKSIREAKAQAEASGNAFYPGDLPKGWNGIADLSQTPLSSFDSPQKSTISRFGDGDDEDDWQRSGSPRRGGSRMPISSSSSSLRSDAEGQASLSFAHQLQSFHPPPFSAMKSRLAETPAKEAARLITRDVLQVAALRNGGDIEDAGLDSPTYEPPSVVKNWATRGYTTTSQAQGGSSPDSPGSEDEGDLSRQQLVADQEEDGDKMEHSFEAEFDAGPPPQPNFRHLADEDDELSAPIGKGVVDEDEELVQGHQGAEGDDWDDSFEGEEEGASLEEPAQDAFAETEIPLRGEPGEENNSFDSDASRSFGDEETLFGAKAGVAAGRPSGASAAAGGGYGMQDDDGSFEGRDGRDRQSAAFRPYGPDDMVTLHGGKLLESQPFEASPLAGRDARYGL